jgi:hypothetical protein
MNRSRILDINNISSVLEVTDENSILYDTDFTNLPETEEAWDIEIEQLVTTLKQYNAAKPITIDKYLEIGTVLESMKLSTIISPNFDTIVRNATKTLDANFNNYVDLDKHSLVDINWINELTTLNNIYTAFGNDAGESSLADMGERVAGSKDQAAIADLLHNVNNSTL